MHSTINTFKCKLENLNEGLALLESGREKNRLKILYIEGKLPGELRVLRGSRMNRCDASGKNARKSATFRAFYMYK